GIEAIVSSSAPVTYQSSWSPPSIGAQSVPGEPVEVSKYGSPEVHASAPAGTIVTKSPGPSGPFQATSNWVPAGTSSGAWSAPSNGVTVMATRASTVSSAPLTYHSS